MKSCRASPHNNMLPTTIIRSPYLRSLLDTTLELCAEQPLPSIRNAIDVAASRIRASYPQAVYRRSLVLSMLDVMPTESTETPGLSHLQNTFPRARLPLNDLEDEASASYAYRSESRTPFVLLLS